MKENVPFLQLEANKLNFQPHTAAFFCDALGEGFSEHWIRRGGLIGLSIHVIWHSSLSSCGVILQVPLWVNWQVASLGDSNIDSLQPLKQLLWSC
jgi:hypothetical protein